MLSLIKMGEIVELVVIDVDIVWSLMPIVESLVLLVEPLRVSVLFVDVCVIGALLTLSKTKLEALGNLGTMSKAMVSH